jgi:hypothetical protein
MTRLAAGSGWLPSALPFRSGAAGSRQRRGPGRHRECGPSALTRAHSVSRMIPRRPRPSGRTPPAIPPSLAPGQRSANRPRYVHYLFRLVKRYFRKSNCPLPGDHGMPGRCGRGEIGRRSRLKICFPSGSVGSSPAVRTSLQAAAFAFSAVHSQRLRLIGSRNMPPIFTPICQRTWASTGPMPGMSRLT